MATGDIDGGILEDILSGGGEIGVALLIAAGIAGPLLAIQVAARFETLTPGGVQTLIDVAQLAVDAAQDIQDLPLDQIIPLDIIPTQPLLFGDEPGGRRILTAFEVEFPDADRNIFIRIEDEGTLSPDELRQRAIDQAADIINRYPEQFGVVEVDPADGIIAGLVMTERKF